MSNLTIESWDPAEVAKRKAKLVRAMLFGERRDGGWFPPANCVFVSTLPDAPPNISRIKERIINIRVHKGVVQGKLLADGHWYTINGVIEASK